MEPIPVEQVKPLTSAPVEHKCIAEMNELLKPHNTCIDIGFDLSGKTWIVVGTGKWDSTKRGRAKVVYATYCPFCGLHIGVEKKKPPEAVTEADYKRQVDGGAV